MQYTILASTAFVDHDDTDGEEAGPGQRSACIPSGADSVLAGRYAAQHTDLHLAWQDGQHIRGASRHCC